jgi:hypothetical protein
MSRTLKRICFLSVATVLGGTGLFWSGSLPTDERLSLVTSAEARVGRPLTPVSYAGVARRTTRRVVVGGAAVAGAAYVAAPVVYGAPPPVVYAPACYQAVDPYGRVYTRCP